MSMTGTLYQPKKYNNRDDYMYLKVYGDDRLLYEASVTGGVFPVDFNIDLTGVLKLRVEWRDSHGEYSYISAYGQLCEVALWT